MTNRKKKAKGAETGKKQARVTKATPPKSSKKSLNSGDWRHDMLSRVRAIILRADPSIIEERKWKKPSNGMAGVPVWSGGGGIICTGETYKGVVKLTFAKGASLDDPARLFNASLEGGTRRAIDLHEGDHVDERALTALVRSAIALNAGTSSRATGSATKKTREKTTQRTTKNAPEKSIKTTKPTPVDGPIGERKSKVKLLSGGNPQIAKGEGNAPVQTYIAAIPGWKREVGRRLDTLIERAVPGVRKAVKWNSPFYGVGDEGWFLSFHCFAKYVKVAFFRGVALKPMPPGSSKQKEVRYLDIHEGDLLDEAPFVDWVKQASRLPDVRL